MEVAGFPEEVGDVGGVVVRAEGLRQVERRAVAVEELQIVVDDRPALEQGVPERVPDRDVALGAVAERQLLHAPPCR